MDKPTHIFKELARCSSSDYSSGEVYLSVNLATGESKIVLTRTVGVTFETKDYEKALKTHENLHGSGRIITIDDLLKIRGKYNPSSQK